MKLLMKNGKMSFPGLLDPENTNVLKGLEQMKSLQVGLGRSQGRGRRKPRRGSWCRSRRKSSQHHPTVQRSSGGEPKSVLGFSQWKFIDSLSRSHSSRKGRREQQPREVL